MNESKRKMEIKLPFVLSDALEARAAGWEKSLIYYLESSDELSTVVSNLQGIEIRHAVQLISCEIVAEGKLKMRVESTEAEGALSYNLVARFEGAQVGGAILKFGLVD